MTCGDRCERTPVALERKHFHVVTAQLPVVGDALRGIELIDGLVAKARLPALAAGERIGEAEGLAGEHGRRDRDLGHGLHAADGDHILGAAHHRLGGEVQRLL